MNGSRPKVLVVSNNGFSNSSSNGRTLGNLFIGWPKEKLAQFCISTTETDYATCDNYFMITDKSALFGFFHLRKAKRVSIDDGKGINKVFMGSSQKRTDKTPFKAIIRNLIWKNRWNSKEFNEWVNAFNPDLVLVMNSDAMFILDIALYVSSSRSIPLVMFNTEGFYFFKKSFYKSSYLFNDFLYGLYRLSYRRLFKRVMKKVALSIHLNSLLADDYREEFGGEHIVIYTGSNLAFDSSDLHTENPSFSYLGNFGFDRQNALVEVAKTLGSINHSYKLDVYGKAPNVLVEDMLKNCPEISYHGVVSYEDVVRVIYSSTILFHAESQNEDYKEALRYGFSTKIADSISSGHPFIMYSSANIAGARYVLETGAAWHADNIRDLRERVLEVLYDKNLRDRVLSVAHHVAEENHNVEKNSFLFQQVLSQVTNDRTCHSNQL